MIFDNDDDKGYTVVILYRKGIIRFIRSGHVGSFYLVYRFTLLMRYVRI